MQENDILLKAIMDGGKHSIIVTHQSGIVKFMNQAAERLYGYAADHFVGRHISNFRREVYDPAELKREAIKFGKDAAKPDELDQVFMMAMGKHEAYEKEWTALRPDGTSIQVLVSVTAMKDEKGVTVGYLSISQDISERKRLERLKSEFISTVSHELRTPLTSIRGALGLMAGGAVGVLPKAAADMVSLAFRNSERLVRIINDILETEKIESGKLAFDILPFDGMAIVRQSLEENRAYAEKHGVRFVLKSEPQDGAWVLADPNRVLQVLANLLSNAAKFSPSGSEVWVQVTRGEHDVRFSVRDFGKGIPETFQSRIFEQFAQSDGTREHHKNGSGLGLSITKKMVEAMGGDIGFETKAGEGTTFTFGLPQAVDSNAKDAKDPVTSELGVMSTRVLVCEDDHDVASLLKLLLENAGFPTDVAHSLSEARKRLHENSYAVLTLDLALPDGDGLEFMNELRANAAFNSLPIVVISAKAEEGRLGVAGDPIELVDWISKPIDETRLVQSLRYATQNRSNDKARILHVEDNDDLRNVLGNLMQDQAEWVGAATLSEARVHLKNEPFDLIVLDLTLPDGSGLEILENMKTFTGRPVPVLILSADEMADPNIRKRVSAILLKSRVSEERVVQTILNLVQNRGEART